MDREILRAMYEKALGAQIMNDIEALRPDDILPLVDAGMWKLYAEIKAILDDDTMEDQTCFYRIEALVNAFEARGIPVNRHDW